jgi:hypothetical protein
MPVQLDDAKRTAIAQQLAEMRSVQNLLILNAQTLLNAVQDDDIRVQLQEMLERDQKNLGLLDTVIGLLDLTFAILFTVFLYTNHQVQKNLPIKSLE